MILCYAGSFLYEGEERQVQSVLERWWIEIDDLRRSAISVHAAFLRQAASAAVSILDRVFGAQILSWRSITIAASLSIISLQTAAMLDDPFRAFAAAERYLAASLPMFDDLVSDFVVWPILNGRATVGTFVTLTGFRYLMWQTFIPL